MPAFPRPGATPEDNASEVAVWIKAFAEASPPPVVQDPAAGDGAGKNASVKRKKPAPKKAGPKKGKR